MSHNMSYFTFESIGVPARINCSCCGSGMDRNQRKPYTGICGHTICEQCYVAKYIGRDGTVPPSPGEFYRCCAPFCDERGFKVGHSVSTSIMGALSLLEQLKWEVNRHLIKIHDKYKAFDIMALQNELQLKKEELSSKQTELFCAEQENSLLEGDFMRVTKDLEETKTKMSMELKETKKKLAEALIGKDVNKTRTLMSNDLEETKKQLVEALIGKEVAEDTLVGVKEYIKGVRKRLEGLPVGLSPDDSPFSTLSQEMEELEVKLHQHKKRPINSPQDPAITGNKEQYKKPRKVSLNGMQVTARETPKPKQEEEGSPLSNSNLPKFPYTAEDSVKYTCTSMESTQENEF